MTVIKKTNKTGECSCSRHKLLNLGSAFFTVPFIRRCLLFKYLKTIKNDDKCKGEEWRGNGKNKSEQDRTEGVRRRGEI